jgi:hypothetical protein
MALPLSGVRNITVYDQLWLNDAQPPLAAPTLF